MVLVKAGDCEARILAFAQALEFGGAEIPALQFLQQVATDGGHVADVRRGGAPAGIGQDSVPGADGRVNPELFETSVERELHSAAQTAASKVHSLKRGGKYQEALEVVAGLRPVVDRFFDGVMVMAEKEDVRKNRLALLAQLLGEFTTIADFSEIGGEERLS